MENKKIMILSAFSQRGIAREMLKGKWKLVATGTLLYLLAVALPPMILQMMFLTNGMLASTISLIYILITTGAFTLGYSMFMLQIVRKENTTPGEIFAGFSHFFKSLGLLVAFTVIIWVCCLPSIILVTMGITLSLGSGAFVSIFCIIAGLGLFYLPIRVSYNYCIAFYIAADNSNLGISAILRISTGLMHGNRWKMFCLNISFIGWILLANIPVIIVEIIFRDTFTDIALNPSMQLISSNLFAYNVLSFIAGLAYIWLMPYMTVATANFYDIISGRLTVKQASDIKLSDGEKDILVSEKVKSIEAEVKPIEIENYIEESIDSNSESNSNLNSESDSNISNNN